MISRYDLMAASSDIDETDLERYPDPLTIDYENLVLTEAPYQYEIDETFIKKPYIVTNALYGVTEYDDIILDINGVCCIQSLKNKEGSILIFPVQKDLLAFYTSNQKGELLA